MLVFLFTLGYFIIIASSVFAIIKLFSLIGVIREKKLQADELEKKLYTELREFQLKTRMSCVYSSKLLKKKDSILGEVVPSLLISLLPFKKIKSLLLLNKLAKKMF